jgi:hypothetical protein
VEDGEDGHTQRRHYSRPNSTPDDENVTSSPQGSMQPAGSFPGSSDGSRQETVNPPSGQPWRWKVWGRQGRLLTLHLGSSVGGTMTRRASGRHIALGSRKISDALRRREWIARWSPRHEGGPACV